MSNIGKFFPTHSPPSPFITLQIPKNPSSLFKLLPIITISKFSITKIILYLPILRRKIQNIRKRLAKTTTNHNTNKFYHNFKFYGLSPYNAILYRIEIFETNYLKSSSSLIYRIMPYSTI